MEEIRITLETLYDILMNEKKREDLQKLGQTFFPDVVGYLKEKKSLLEAKKGEDDLFAVGEREKLGYELKSIRRILKEIYEKREKKLIDIALNKSRTKSDIIDASAMLKEEKDFYEQLVGLLDGYREGILASLFKGEVPLFMRPEIRIGLEEKKEEAKTSPEAAESRISTENRTEPVANQTSQSKPEESMPKLKRIKFIHPVPSFVWKELDGSENIREYGPFETGEEMEIFPEVADLIIEKGRAVAVG